MIKKSYIEKMITLNELIYIDTSSAMFDDWFEEFVDQARDCLVRNNKKITIIPAVYHELCSKEHSEDCDKAFKAKRAKTIIDDNCDIFDLLAPNSIRETFADFSLLNKLMINRRFYRQLLITNDRMLASDANDLNSIESVEGKQISVCRLCNGYLKASDCTLKNSSYLNTKEIERTEVRYVDKIRYVEKEQSFFDKYFLPFSTFCLGIVTGVSGLLIYDKVLVKE